MVLKVFPQEAGSEVEISIQDVYAIIKAYGWDRHLLKGKKRCKSKQRETLSGSIPTNSSAIPHGAMDLGDSSSGLN